MNKTLNVFATLSIVAAAAGPALADARSEAAAARADIEKMIGFVPGFMKAVPDLALPGAWAELKGLEANPETAIPCKFKELIGLAVAAQMPCKSCIYGYTKLALANGATQAQVAEAVALAGITRHWSTFFNGIQLDEAKFRADIKQVVETFKKGMAAGTPPPAPLEVVDARTALKDMEQTFGAAPEFARKFPAASLAGAWRQMRDVEMAPGTAVPEKYKTLIGLAVSAQIPCKYCVFADTEFARLMGISEQEISEAVAMAALARDWGTLVSGLQVDEAGFRRDMDRLARVVSKMGASQPRAAAPRTAATASR
jgi:AhpD family alkylhydroperoxidase